MRSFSESSVGTPERIARDFEFVEGPVWLASGSPLLGRIGGRSHALLFNDIPADRTYWYADGKVGVFRAPSHGANGNTLDRSGRLVTCEHLTRRVTRTELDGAITVLAERYDGRRLNSPNDVVVRGVDGSVYFTDPPYGVEPEQRELQFQGVHRVAADGAPATLLADDFEKPNGLVFSPDGATLFIADTERGHVRAFDCDAGGTLARDRVLCRAERPDGLRVDVDGNLYIAAMTAVEVVDPTGRPIGRIELPERPANLAFGGGDGRDLHICARTSVYRVRVPVPGAAIPG